MNSGPIRPPLKQVEPKKRPYAPRWIRWRDRRIDYLREKGWTLMEAIADCDRQNGAER
jgi:hypothetical protein